MHTHAVNISIMSDGDRTVAEAILIDMDLTLPDAESFLAASAGSASREPGDKSDPAIGEALATARALRSLANRLEKRAAGTMKHREDIKVHRAEIAERLDQAITETLRGGRK